MHVVGHSAKHASGQQTATGVYVLRSNEILRMPALPTAFSLFTVQGLKSVSQGEGSEVAFMQCRSAAGNDEEAHILGCDGPKETEV